MATRVFLFGTLRSPEKLAVVLGRDSAVCEPATLDDHTVYYDADEKFPVLSEAPGETLTGIVLEATAEDLRRLDWYEAAFHYGRVTVTVAGAPAEVYRLERASPGPRPWVFDEWFDAEGPVVIDAARQAMRLYPETPAKIMGQKHPMMMARAESARRAQSATSVSAVRKGPGRKGVTNLGASLRHDGFFALDEVHVTHRRFDGGTEEIKREVFLSTDASLVLPYDPKRGEVVLIEQFRAGTYRRGEPQPWTLEPVAGLVDAGESPEDCALREAREEAGLKIDKLVPMPSGYPSPGATAEFYHCFVGLVDLADYHPGLGGMGAEGEDILAHVLTVDVALSLMQTGEINVLPLAYMLTWIAAHRETLSSY